MSKDIILIGDKILVEPDMGEAMTEAGLYLPQTVKDKEKVFTGKVVKVGPGYPVLDPSSLEKEPWENKTKKLKYFPLQAQERDFCMFIKEQAVEIEFENKKFFVVPHSAILLLVRSNISEIPPKI